METEEKVSKGYIIGFNHGYILAKNDPTLLENAIKERGDNDYLKGLDAGKKQYEKERKIEELNERFEKSKSLNKGRSH
jgi:hypothetical protein